MQAIGRNALPSGLIPHVFQQFLNDCLGLRVVAMGKMDIDNLCLLIDVQMKTLRKTARLVNWCCSMSRVITLVWQHRFPGTRMHVYFLRLPLFFLTCGVAL